MTVFVCVLRLVSDKGAGAAVKQLMAGYTVAYCKLSVKEKEFVSIDNV